MYKYSYAHFHYLLVKLLLLQAHTHHPAIHQLCYNPREVFTPYSAEAHNALPLRSARKLGGVDFEEMKRLDLLQGSGRGSERQRDWINIIHVRCKNYIFISSPSAIPEFPDTIDVMLSSAKISSSV